MLKLQTVQKELIKLAAHYPESGHRPATLATISEDYFDALRYLSEKEFRALVKWGRENCKYFPKIVDLQSGLGNIERRRDSVAQLPELPSRVTDEEARKNRAKLSVLLKRVGREITTEDADRKFAEIDKA